MKNAGKNKINVFNFDNSIIAYVNYNYLETKRGMSVLCKKLIGAIKKHFQNLTDFEKGNLAWDLHDVIDYHNGEEKGKWVKILIGFDNSLPTRLNLDFKFIKGEIL